MSKENPERMLADQVFKKMYTAKKEVKQLALQKEELLGKLRNLLMRIENIEFETGFALDSDALAKSSENENYRKSIDLIQQLGREYARDKELFEKIERQLETTTLRIQSLNALSPENKSKN